MHRVFTFLKNWTLPVAIAVGTVSYLVFALEPTLDAAGDALLPFFETLLPITIFLTLFVTFSKVDFHLMRLHRWHFYILCTQLTLTAVLVAIILYKDFISFLNQDSYLLKFLLEAVLICIIAPCASASPVVTAKLGGNLTQMTTFVLLSSLVCSILIPIVFPLVEPQSSTILHQFFIIFRRLALVLLFPLLLGAIVRHRVRPLYNYFMKTPDIGFYLWSVSLAITSGITVRNIVHSHAASHMLGDIALLTLLTAVAQFGIGRLVGKVVGEKICTGQGMFQKNTGLAIWIAYTYLTPEASIGAGCYVLWQNLINSYELWQHRRSGAPSPDKAAASTAD